MDRILTTVIFTFLILFSFQTSLSQVKREIVPMHSTCKDVSQILNVETCKEAHETYFLPNETIEITYSTDYCHIAYKKRWDVPIGTVTSVIKFPKEAKKLNDLGIKIDQCQKTTTNSDLSNSIIYSCSKEGITLNVIDEIVTSIIYLPLPSDSALLCSKLEKNRLSLDLCKP